LQFSAFAVLSQNELSRNSALLSSCAMFYSINIFTQRTLGVYYEILQYFIVKSSLKYCIIIFLIIIIIIIIIIISIIIIIIIIDLLFLYSLLVGLLCSCDCQGISPKKLYLLIFLLSSSSPTTYLFLFGLQSTTTTTASFLFGLQ